MAGYNFKRTEKKWTARWLKDKTYEPNLKKAKKPYYNLMMFPYPSAEGLHVGNMYAFTGTDVHGRFQRMRGNDVFEPIGLDGFGIHSENYAMKIGAHPLAQSKKSEKNFYRQLQMIGNGFAWNERLETYDPEYYRWTQWVFIQMYKHGLAYRKKGLVNWCPSCKTVLSDEQVQGGECERCGTVAIKKELEQWFFAITKYADRLLKNLDTIDWSEKVKIAQKNWIGKSEGALIQFQVKCQGSSVKCSPIDVFTTRPDTLFGATYIVLAPENNFIEEFDVQISNIEEVRNYIEQSKQKSEIDRTAEDKEKTGVELTGIKAINPANGEEIPVFIADYVLNSYGTGAVMAVPAHDKRDFAFAQKYNLPIRWVIDPTTGSRQENPEHKDKIVAMLENEKGQILTVNWGPKLGGRLLVGGTGEPGEEPIKTARREVAEETGYHDLELVSQSDESVHHEYFAYSKQKAFIAHTKLFHFKVKGVPQKAAALEENEKGKFKIEWVNKEHARKEIIDPLHRYAFEKFVDGGAYDGPGILANSGKFTGLHSEDAKWKITDLVKGEKKTNFKLRDWLISRQRYWGPPIPMIHCETCEWQPVPEKDLPVKLPNVKDFRPTGTGVSPLATVESFYKTKCPVCKGPARRETDVSDTFLDSAWYFFRYPDVKNSKAPFDNKTIAKWLPVDMYIGGAEHSVLHLLYTRFVTMFFKHLGLIDFEEPFAKFRAHGLLIKEGMKMSKSKGNVVNPDEYIKKFGADTLRTYLMFLGPFQQGGDWRDEGIMGVVRFLNRVWGIGKDLAEKKSSKKAPISDWMHGTIKSVTEDISTLNYNTCISALMIALNRIEEGKDVPRVDFEIFLKLLAPFAPFITEELWSELGHASSIHREEWPMYDEKKLQEKTFELLIQVNGKLRGKTAAPAGITEKDAAALALNDDGVKAHLEGREPKKVIFVPNKLINFVIEY